MSVYVRVCVRVCVKARGRWKLCQCGGTKVRQKQAARTAQQHEKQPATTSATTTTARQTDSSIDRGTGAGWQRQIQEQRNRKKIIIKCVACFLARATRLAETIAWYVAVGAAAVAAAIVAVFANMLSLNR